MKLGVTLKLVITVETTGRHQGVGQQTGFGYLGIAFCIRSLVYIDRGYKINIGGGLNKYNSITFLMTYDL
jgi:hypothetical protein